MKQLIIFLLAAHALWSKSAVFSNERSSLVSLNLDRNPNKDVILKDDNPESLKLYPNSKIKTIEYYYDKLPLKGTPASIPWSGSYWASYLDSVNYRWAGNNTLSPIEKYEKAFNVTGLVDDVEKRLGINSPWLPNTPCKQQSDCEKGSYCVTRGGNLGKICIANWYGICHGWSAAATSEPSPVKPVVANGVQFEVSDIKALVSVLHDYTFKNSIDLKVLGTRCKISLANMKMDQFGRPTDRSCRQNNPATFHLALTNIVGLHQLSFFFNKRDDLQIWNQPVAGYEIVISKFLTLDQAITYFPNATEHNNPFQPNASFYVFNRLKLNYTEETTAKENSTKLVVKNVIYEYLLELDSQRKIIGGEWLGRSIKNHPDFFGFVVSKNPNRSLFNGKLKWKFVKEMLNISTGQKFDASYD